MTYVTHKFRYRHGNREDFAAVEVQAQATEAKTHQSAEILARQWVEDLTAEKSQTYVFIDCSPLVVATEKVEFPPIQPDKVNGKAARA